MDIAGFKTPGQYLRAILKEKGLTQSTLAAVMSMDKASIGRIIADKKPITARLAIRLGEVFGLPAENFLQLQKNYELAIARVTVEPNPHLYTRARVFSELPVAEMIKRGWLDAEDMWDLDKVESALAKFFGVESIEDIAMMPHAAKKTNVSSDVTPSQLAWLYRVKQIAEDMIVSRYSPLAVEVAIDKIRNLLSAAEEARKVPRILTESGIRFVMVESLSSAKIDGACFWLNDFSPVIGMSVRFDRIDNFYFVLRHELEHVLRRHGRDVVIVDAELEGERAGSGAGIPEEERQANEAAADFCVPRTQLQRFVARKSPFFAERDIIGFARTLKIHPGLVAGQLQHQIGRYDRFRNHLVKIRSIVAPSAMVDGWGDVAPVDA